MKDFSGKKMNLAAMHLYMNDDTQVLRKQAFLKSYKPLNKMAFDDTTGKKTSVISLIHYYLPNTKLDLIYSAVEIYKRLPLYMLFKKIMTTFNLTFSLNNK